MRLATLAMLLMATTPAVAIEHATISIDGTGTATKVGGTSDFFLDAGSSTGEYPVRIGVSAADDAAGGVLINAVSELDRGGLYATGSTVRDNSQNSSNTRGTAGGLAISSTLAGATDPPTAGTPTDSNLSAAYFSFASGWQGGNLLSSTENVDSTFGVLDTLEASTGITLGAQVQTTFLDQPGVSKVTIPGVTDSNRQGILVATSASKVGRFTTVAPSLDGDGFILRSVDNDGYFEFDPASDPSTTGEGGGVDTPVSFAFVPVGTPGVTMARVATNGSTMVEGEQVGVPLVHSGADFTVTSDNLTAPGRFRLEINGFTPADGTLIVTPIGATENPGGNAADNVLTYESDATGWNILSQDMEADFLYADPVGEATPLDGNGQAANGADPFFNFLFIPNEGAPTAPGAVPEAETLTNFNRSRVIGWNTEVTILDNANGNAPGDVNASVAGSGNQKTSDVRIDLFANRGDLSVAVDGAYLNTREGLLLTTVTEGFRQNENDGGFDEFGVAMTTGFDEEWGIVMAAADNVSGSDEHNINTASAFFGVDSGFRMAIGQDIEGEFGDPYETTKLDISLPGVNALTDGILIASPFGNDDNFASAEPNADGSGWEVRLFDNTADFDASTDERTEPDAASWIYLPYETENLIAGLVAEDGSLVSSSDGAGTEWTLTAEEVFRIDGSSEFQYRLSIADTSKSPENGMLLLTSTGDGVGGGEGTVARRDNSLYYEADGDDFIIQGIDHVSDGITADPGMGIGIVDFEKTGFMFAYIDFDNAPIAPPIEVIVGDYNGDGFVNIADYTVWRDNLGSDASEFAPGSRDPLNAGVVSADDYASWKSNFGASSASIGLSQSANVPEPSSLVMVAGLLIGLCRVRRIVTQ